MKNIATIILSFLLLCCPAGLMAQQGNKLVVPVSRPGQPYVLNINAHGPVTVSGYEGKEIIIEIIGGENHIISGNGLKRMALGTSGLVAQENGNIVSIRSEPGEEASLILKIPSNLTRLKLRSMAGNSHEIIVNNLSGELEIMNGKGGIKLNNISGSVVSSTLKGSIVASFTSVNPKAAMAFSAFNGSIEVSLPQDIKANVKLKTERGSVLSDFDLKPILDIARTAEGNNLYRYRIDQSINASINGGGPEIMMKTITGNITIRKSK